MKIKQLKSGYLFAAVSMVLNLALGGILIVHPIGRLSVILIGMIFVINGLTYVLSIINKNFNFK